MINYASFGRRFAALFIDALLVGAVNGFINVALSSAHAQYLTGVLSFAISAGYSVYMIGSRGQTVGKMALGIKVVSVVNNGSVDYVTAFLREVVGKFVSSIVFGLGYLWAIWDPQKQTWHDKIAKTIVIRV